MARSSSDSSSDKAEEADSSSKRESGSSGTRSRASSSKPSRSGASRSSGESGSRSQTAKRGESRASSSSAKGEAKGKSGDKPAGGDKAKSDTKATSDAKPKSGEAKRSTAKSGTTKSELSKTPAKKSRDEDRGPGFFGTIARFFRQVLAELKKVVTPTRAELFRYTGVVLVFVIIMMALVAGLDLLFGWGASWAFGTGTEVQWPDFTGLFGGGDPAATDPAATEPAVPAE